MDDESRQVTPTKGAISSASGTQGGGEKCTSEAGSEAPAKDWDGSSPRASPHGSEMQCSGNITDHTEGNRAVFLLP